MIYDHQQSFDRAIYLTYVERHLNNEFKKVSKDEFYDKLYNDKLDRIEAIDFDKSNIYRLADTKRIWLSKYNRVLGEVWIEGNEYSKDYVESYWLKNN